MAEPIRIITVTVSDTRTAATDLSGKALQEELAAFELVRHEIVPDIADRIKVTVEDAIADADAVVVTGGTGIGPRDITIETLAFLFDRPLNGFGEAFRRLSWDAIGPRAILTRALGGLVGNTFLFILPGSEHAARLGARELIAPILQHAIDLVNGRTKHKGGH
jgi:molybdenum cofactor biosynthesis protein B